MAPHNAAHSSRRGRNGVRSSRPESVVQMTRTLTELRAAMESGRRRRSQGSRLAGDLTCDDTGLCERSAAKIACVP